MSKENLCWTCSKCMTTKCPKHENPTKQGVHLIVRPFNLKAFKDSFPDVDVHKNSMGTLLYFPESLS